MSEFAISQSLMKDWEEYLRENFCGLQFAAKYFENIEFPTSEAMQYGVFFEYNATGGLPKNGEVPVPKLLTKGKREGELAAKWQYAMEQAENFKASMVHYKFRIKEIGKKLRYTDQDGITYQGTLDVIAVDERETIEDRAGRPKPNPDYMQEILLDLKLSGLLDNKWEDLGWDVNALHYKSKIMIQPVHYTWLYEKLYGRNPSFYFFVHSNTNGEDRKIFKVTVDPDYYSKHEKRMKEAYGAISFQKKTGFTLYPDVSVCPTCPVRLKCSQATNVARIQEVYYAGETSSNKSF